MLRRLFKCLTADPGKLHRITTKDRHITIIHEHHLTGIRQYRRNIRSDKKLLLANTNNHRRPDFGSNQNIRAVLAQDTDRKRSLELRQPCPNRSFKRARRTKMLVDQVCNNLGIGFTAEYPTTLL